MTCYEGGCHCGAITVRFTTEQPASTLVPRADQCGFCRRHNAAVISDPAGRLEIDIAQRAGAAYRFGLNITDFHVCQQCGVFVAASGIGESASLGVVNIHALRDRDLFSPRTATVSFDGESLAERQARRRLHWTPASMALVADPSGTISRETSEGLDRRGGIDRSTAQQIALFALGVGRHQQKLQ